MKVCELMEILQQFPCDWEVKINNVNTNVVSDILNCCGVHSYSPDWKKEEEYLRLDISE